MACNRTPNPFYCYQAASTLALTGLVMLGCAASEDWGSLTAPQNKAASEERKLFFFKDTADARHLIEVQHAPHGPGVWLYMSHSQARGILSNGSNDHKQGMKILRQTLMAGLEVGDWEYYIRGTQNQHTLRRSTIEDAEHPLLAYMFFATERTVPASEEDAYFEEPSSALRDATLGAQLISRGYGYHETSKSCRAVGVVPRTLRYTEATWSHRMRAETANNRLAHEASPLPGAFPTNHVRCEWAAGPDFGNYRLSKSQHGAFSTVPIRESLGGSSVDYIKREVGVCVHPLDLCLLPYGTCRCLPPSEKRANEDSLVWKCVEKILP